MKINFFRVQDDGVGVAGNNFLQYVESSAVPREFETVKIQTYEYTVDAVSWSVRNGFSMEANVYLRQIGS